MRKEYNVAIERDEAGFSVASVPSLPGCHTQARSLDRLMERIRGTMNLCLEALQEKPEPLEFVGFQKVLVG